jgi:hypothetical protein
MQYRCSKHSVILSETRMRRTRVTPLRYLAATDASGGVARQQKITHAHESPFYHYAQFPHLGAPLTSRTSGHSLGLFRVQNVFVSTRNNNSIQFNSIQFNSSLLMCPVNSQMANYTNSTTYKHK